MNHNYSDPRKQFISDTVYKNLVTSQNIIDRMTSTVNMTRRVMDKSIPTELTQSQRDNIAKNKGIHIISPFFRPRGE